MNMKCIYDIPRFCDVNIAIDEIFFTKENFEEIFRFYRWLKPSYTIGYFQKYPVKEDSYPVIRRLTGGLSVLHNKDLSYSLIVSDKMWPYIYNQEKTYKLVHETIRKSLKTINIICDDTSKKVDTIKNYCCVNTLYKDDLLLNGKKIVGSCQRRRGTRILVEGSIHLDLQEEQKKIFTRKFFKILSETLKCDTTDSFVNNIDLNLAKKLCEEKYNKDKWNKLF